MSAARPELDLRAFALALAIASALGAGACSVEGGPAPARERAARDAPVPVAAALGGSSARRPLRKDETTGAIQKKAADILSTNADKPIGTEVPFELGGRRYVARIEEHYRDPNSDESGPKGAHRGVSIYTEE